MHVKKKILVLSDSHGDREAMLEAVRKENPQMIFHLGDYWRDGVWLHEQVPALPLCQVAGNCDRDGNPDQVETVMPVIEGVPLYLTHGHRHQVKLTLLRLFFAAKEAGAQVALYGHTHVASCREKDGILLLNPGACGGARGSYGILTLDNGTVHWETRGREQED